MTTKISYSTYCNLLLEVMKTSRKAQLNCDVPKHIKGNLYFKSEQGISYLQVDGFMAGLCRIKDGDENVAQVHQEARKYFGGYFLECYEGKLVELYESQGFDIVGRVKFDEEQAKEGWQKDRTLKNKPDVVFLSLYDKPTRYGSYDLIYKYAQADTSWMVRINVPQRDSEFKFCYSIEEAIKGIGCKLDDLREFKALDKVIYRADDKTTITVIKHERNSPNKVKTIIKRI